MPLLSRNTYPGTAGTRVRQAPGQHTQLLTDTHIIVRQDKQTSKETEWMGLVAIAMRYFIVRFVFASSSPSGVHVFCVSVSAV